MLRLITGSKQGLVRLSGFYDDLVRFCAPVFVMISGALFFSKDIPVKKLYSKYIFRIFTALIFWSFVYVVAGFMKNHDLPKAAGHFITE